MPSRRQFVIDVEVEARAGRDVLAGIEFLRFV